MMKKAFVTLALAAKALTLAAAVLMYTGSANADSEDCPVYCVPPPCPNGCEEPEES